MERRLLAVALISSGVVLAFIAHPLVSREVYTDTDLGNLHLPIRHFYAESLAAGDDFIWFPYQFNGHNIHGEGQYGLLHPLNLASYRLLPLDVAFNLELLRNYVFLLLGSYWLGRRWGLRRDAAGLAALAFAFAGFNLMHFIHLNMIAVIAHLPFLLIAIDTLLRSDRRRTVALACVATSLLTVSQILIGFPQMLWISWVAAGLYAMHLLLADRSRLSRLPWLLLALGLALPLGAVQLLPQLEGLALSERAWGGEALPFEHSLHPLNLIQLVSPLFFARRAVGDAESLEFALYSGALLPIALTWLLMRRNELGDHARLAMLLVCVASLALLLALGEWGGIYPLQTLVPVLDKLRAPARYIVLVQLAAAYLVAIAYTDLAHVAESGSPVAWRRLALLLVPVGVALLAIAFWYGLLAGSEPASIDTTMSGPLRMGVGPAAIALAALLVALVARGHRAALAALILFVVADQASYGLPFMRRSPTSGVDEFAKQWPVPRAVQGHRLHWGPPALSMRHVRLSSGYAALVPRRMLETDQYVRPRHPDASLLASLRVSDIAYAYAREIPEPLPRARLVARTRPTTNLARQIGTIDVRTTALVEPMVSLGDPSLPPGRARFVSERPGRIEIETDTPGEQLLVLAESHHPGWRVAVDGEPAPLVRVYGDFMGCVVPGGIHRVHFVFAPESLRRGKLLSWTGAGLLTGLYFLLAHSPILTRRAR